MRSIRSWNSLFCFEWDEEHEAWYIRIPGSFSRMKSSKKRMTELHMDKHAILEWMAKDMLNNFRRAWKR